MIQPLFGLEIEAEVNAPLAGTIPLGDYHHPAWISDYWGTQEDSSLSRHKWEGSSMMEFTSAPFTLDRFTDVFQDFKNIFQDRTFLDVLTFNRTCGGHIHVSCWETSEPSCHMYDDRLECEYCEDGKTVKQLDIPGRDYIVHGNYIPLLASMPVIERIRAEIIDNLPALARERYSREYSRLLTVPPQPGLERYSEWNYLNESHFEYRSFNLSGVRSWAGIYKQYKHALDVITKHMINTPPEGLKEDVSVIAPRRRRRPSEGLFNLDFISTPNPNFQMNHPPIRVNHED